MKKKISLLLCVLVAVFSFVGCSGKSNEGVSAAQKDEMKAVSEFLFGLFTTDENDEILENWLSMSDYELNYELMAMSYTYQQYGVPAFHVESDDFRSMIKAWQGAVDECGDFVSVGDFEVDEDGATVTATVEFKERDATVAFGFDEKQNLESMDVSAKFSMGEILTKAGLNTLLGMGTVFSVLILLAFLISLMKYIPVLTEWFQNRTQKQADAVSTKQDSAGTADMAAQATDSVDDLELIAVITAAIAAQEGTTTDGFVVRSIRRRPSNNWN